MIRILCINTIGLNTSGITSILYDYYSLFDKNQFLIETVSYYGDNREIVERFKKSNINVEIVPNRRTNPIKYFFALIKLMKTKKYDIVHVNGNSATMTIELLAAKISGIGIRIAHSHNSTCEAKKMDKLMRPIFYHLYNYAFACGHDAGEWLFPNKEYTIIKNGRNPEVYKYNVISRKKMREVLNIDDDVIALGHVGHYYNNQKNQEFLINVFKNLINKKLNVHLYLVGDGEKKNEIYDLVNNLNLSKYVTFLGNINYIPDYLQAMDFMIFPSLFEGLPLVVIEWQIAGLKSLISSSISEECKLCDLVHFESLNKGISEWTRTIIHLISEKNDRDTQSKIAIKRATIEGYNLIENVEYLQKFYISILNN